MDTEIATGTAMLRMMSLGLIVGVAFGYALQRGRFCMNSTFRDILLARDLTLLRAYLLALLIQMVGVRLMAAFGLFGLGGIAPFFWMATLFGGFIFGLGMAFSGGCASGSTYRSGEGMVGSIIALLGFVFGMTMTNDGVLEPVQAAFRSRVVEIDGQPATLDRLLGVNPWMLVVTFVTAGGWWLLKSPSGGYQRGWSWARSGIIIGLIATAAWPISTLTGREYGLSVTEPIRTISGYLLTGDAERLTWGSFMWVGLIAGAHVAARSRGEFSWRAPGAQRLLQALGGGLLMGIGAGIAGGCNIGHGLTGVPLFGLGSLTATLSVILGVWTGVYLLFGSVAFERRVQSVQRA
ncbi:permease [Candidatus Methylomirabilis lanthanidiphila]|uniref:Permease n=1 Tax=Candidatus Methylomirabilis lanthanidiphila TaxID=2211376 RepID=A0A564ZK16_9BACT|nr:YeeE/YedE family protein [Candidatus Methylomirabilis lanthanidiphila]VUZ85665.1 permease [Candidatus Methylomirabilis lanthanidiphila]